MKKLLSFMLVAVLGLSLSAQVIDQFPAIEGFEGSSNPGSHNFFLHWTEDWDVTYEPDEPSSPINGGYNSYYFVYCFADGYSVYDTLVTYAFDLRFYDHAKLSFRFANPNWDGDIDELSIGYRQSVNDAWTIAKIFNSAHNSWTYAEIDLPTGDYYQICFIVRTQRGYGVYLDNVQVDIPDFQEVTSFPWNWDFNNGIGPFMQEFNGCYRPWFTAYGNMNNADNEINEGLEEDGDLNALFYSQSEDWATLISPILKLGNADSAVVDFYYSMENYQDDVDELYLAYRESPNHGWHKIWLRTDYMNHWDREWITLPNLTDTYQIGFTATGNYGYGVTLDMITVRTWGEAGIEEVSSTKPAISVYPNPATDYINVSRAGNDEMFIYNVFGSLVKSTNENRIDVSGFAPVVYTVKTSEGTVKFVK